MRLAMPACAVHRSSLHCTPPDVHLASISIPFGLLPKSMSRYSRVMWDNWWASPVFLATLATAPLKWVPWADKCWLWPGLI